MRRLRRSKGHSRRPEDAGRLLLEGPHLLAAAIDNGIEIEEVLAAPDWPRPEWLATPETQITRVEPGLLTELADADTPRGVVALARLPPRSPGDLTELIAARRSGCIVLLDRISDPANLGAVARVADGAGAVALLITVESVSWRHPRALRSSTGSLLRLPVFSDLDTAELSRLPALAGWPWYGLTPRCGEDLFRTVLPERLVLVVGSESHGLSTDSAARCERSLTIPTRGDFESLNLAVSTAVVLFELVRQQRDRESRAPSTP